MTWQNPATRAMLLVGCLSLQPDGTWSYWYVERVRAVPGFKPFAHFPDVSRVYRSADIFPMFANRVMSPQRPDYRKFLDALDLHGDATPFDILARSSGNRATDTIRVYPEPGVDPVTGVTTCLFLTHGVRHLEGVTERIGQLHSGDRLDLQHEPGNPANPRALLLDAEGGQPVGYVPDILVDYVHTMLDYRGVEVRVYRVNRPPAPITLRLLCWLAGPWPPGPLPFTGPDYEPFREGTARPS